jgi:hypothetical protein
MSYFYQAFKKISAVFLLIAFSQRALAINIPVTNNNNSGAGSLAAAIVTANGTAGADVITFALPVGQETIILTTPLAPITETVFIDGYSQAGSVQGPIGTRTIVVNIDATATGATMNTFVISADNVTIAGLAIYGAPNYNIALINSVDNFEIWGCYVSTNSTGTAAGLGGFGGIGINVGASDFSTGIIIGTDGDGVNDANEGNLISGSGGTNPNGFGIVFWRTATSIIAGNIIGLDKNGDVGAMGNSQDGILLTVEADGNIIGTNGDGTSDALEGNRIAANGAYGITIAVNSDNNWVAGNIIGLATGDVAAGNTLAGINILNASTNRIGTNADGANDAAEANIISANGNTGITIITNDFFGFHGNSNDNIVAGNIIGTDASLTLDLGNTGSGIFLFANITAGATALNVTNNIIGSNNDGVNDAAEGNIITNNDNGITIQNPVSPSLGSGNKISRNRIFANSVLGIDLAGDGVSVNDDGDGDAGANDLLNAPVIMSTQVTGANLVITGFTRPGSVVEFYVADAGPSPNPLPGGFTKSFGEGATFLFRAQDDATLGAVTDANLLTGTYDGSVEGTGAGGTRTENAFSFTIPTASLPVAVTAGTRITALAYLNTTGAGSSSEFGGAVSASSLPVNLTSFKGRLNDGNAELTWTTSEEVNNSHFEIERSANGQSYAKVGTVKGHGGTNNTYNFTDAGPLAAINYYRLKQVDIDGQSTYTRVLVLRNDIGAITAKAAPSPFTSFINISYKLQKEENIRIRLMDVSGRVVKTINTRGGVGVNTLNVYGLDNLPRGSYTVELTGETVSFRQQVLKQ